MKKYLALLIMSCIVLMSMSDCQKDEDGMFVRKEWVSVEINDETHTVESGKLFSVRNPSFPCVLRMWDTDSLLFRLNSAANHYKEEYDVKYKLQIKTTGMFELGQWYPIVSGESYAKWMNSDDSYVIVDGMMRLVEYNDPGENGFIHWSIYRFKGEFWFDAVNENDPEDVMTARNGEFSILARVYDDREIQNAGNSTSSLR